MKKSSKIITLFVMLIVCFCAFLGLNTINVKAVDFTIKEENKTEYQFDSTLFSVIQKMYAQLVGVNVPGFNAYCFSDELSSITPKPGTDAEKIKNDLTNGILNLTTGENAVYDCLKNRTAIKDIRGLNFLKLDNITTLILDDNNLTSIEKTDLDSLTNLQNLSVNNNKLVSFEINPDIKQVNNVNLSGNRLTKVDISNLKEYNGQKPTCDLSNNQIKKIDDIVFPATKLQQLNLCFNNLSVLTNEEWASLNSNMVSGVVADIIIQGVQNFNNVSAGDKITIYQNNILPDLRMIVSYNSSSSFYNQNGDNEICKSEALEDIETVVIPAGKIKVEFYSEGYLVNKTNFSYLDEQIINVLSSSEYDVKLKAPIITGYHDGKVLEKLTEDGDIKVVLSLSDVENLPNKEDVLSSAKISYNTKNSSNSVDATEINVTENGTYTFLAFCNFDGIKGNEVEFSVKRSDMSGVILGIVIIVIIFVVCAAIYFLGKWIRDGAVIAPLTELEIFKVNRKRKTPIAYDREDRKSQLDGLNSSGKENTAYYNEDSIEEDLNKYDYNFGERNYYNEDENSLDENEEDNNEDYEQGDEDYLDEDSDE